jgi:hypothetical protein
VANDMGWVLKSVGALVHGLDCGVKYIYLILVLVALTYMAYDGVNWCDDW